MREWIHCATLLSPIGTATLRIVTLNCNGLRASARKGLFDWLPQAGVDVLCLQEIRITQEQFDKQPEFAPDGWHIALNPAERKGYSGVGLYMRRAPDSLDDRLGDATFDSEGRYLEARYGDLSVVSLYVPSGTSNDIRLTEKYRVLDWLLPLMQQWKDSGREYIVCGDVNIAHRNIDLKNWRSNQKNSGFLPEERAWLDRLFEEAGWVDAFRSLHPDAEGEAYTWWSQRGRARENNVGWRIDYHLCTPGIAAKLEAMHVDTARNLSDHAPLAGDYDHRLE